jgi:hypothetical protein
MTGSELARSHSHHLQNQGFEYGSQFTLQEGYLFYADTSRAVTS